MNLVTTPVIYGLGAALLASLLFGGWQCSEKQQARTGEANAEKALSDYKAAAAEGLAKYQAEARQQEHRHAADMARIATEHQEALTHAKADADRLVADLRAGNVKLQERWRGCAATRVPGPAGAAGQPDGRAADREQGAADLVSAARACDAQVKGLQEVVRSDRAKP